MLRVLFLGDIVGRLGRRTVGKILPSLKKERSINLCIANGENLAGGRGLTKEKASEIISYGVDWLTGGDHTFWRLNFTNEIGDLPVLRCANLETEYPGYGSVEINVEGLTKKVLLLSLLGSGSEFIREKAVNPFLFVEEFLGARKLTDFAGILLDFHAETSSEKNALAWFLDGKVSSLVGTHTHVPTSDQRILPGGTAFVTDLGMVGSREGVLGVKKEIIIERFRSNNLQPFEWVEKGSAIFNSLLVEIDPETGRSVSVERVDRLLE